MMKGGILTLVLNLFFFSIVGYIVFSMLVGLFPVLAVLFVVLMAVGAVSWVVRILRVRYREMDHRKKYDEFGNRRTRATVIEMSNEKTGRDDRE